MIDAKKAREIATNITSSASVKQLDSIDKVVWESSVLGHFSADVSELEISQHVADYIEHVLGYKLDITTSKTNGHVLTKKISW
jgi:hypothetical protein